MQLPFRQWWERPQCEARKEGLSEISRQLCEAVGRLGWGEKEGQTAQKVSRAILACFWLGVQASIWEKEQYVEGLLADTCSNCPVVATNKCSLYYISVYLLIKRKMLKCLFFSVVVVLLIQVFAVQIYDLLSCWCSGPSCARALGSPEKQPGGSLLSGLLAATKTKGSSARSPTAAAVACDEAFYSYFLSTYDVLTIAL